MLWVLYGVAILLAGGLHVLADASVRDSAGLLS